MSMWREWGREPFDEARAQAKPILLWLAADDASRALDGGLESLIDQRFVAVRLDVLERPDVFRRYKDGAKDWAVLSFEGRVLERLSSSKPEEAGQALRRLLEGGAGTGAAAPARKDGPVWTGAVGESTARPLDPAAPRQVLESLKARLAAEPADLAAMELLVYAAVEWKDAWSAEFVRTKLEAAVKAELAAPAANRSPLKAAALWARLAWDAYAATGSPGLKTLAEWLSGVLVHSFYDGEEGAFRSFEHVKRYYGDENAMAVLALWRAYAFSGDPKQKAMAQEALFFLASDSYQEHRGVFHRNSADPDGGVWGLLDDNAWTVLALEESFLMTGHKPYRELADTILKYLLQEMWGREKGGFIDRAAKPDDVGVLKEKLLSYELNAVAFEGFWRLHELKGNQSYKKWMDWGLRNLVSAASETDAVYLAKAEDMLLRGRSDLELVGRLEDEKTQALLSAIHRCCVPRKIISFIDPDDQDYIMAHKLEAANYPRLFVCRDLKRVSDTDDPAGVKPLLEGMTV